jgi:hypothetical protein
MPVLIVAAAMAALLALICTILAVALILEARNRPRRTDG